MSAPTLTASASPASSQPERGAPGAVGVVALGHAVNDSYAYVVAALLPVLIPELGVSLALAGLLVSASQLTSSFCQPVLGYLADRFGGGRWMAWSGVALSGLATSTIGLAPNYEVVVLLVMTAGIGTALWHPVSAGMVVQGAPPTRRAFWMSAYISVGNFGLGIGPLAIGFVLRAEGLRGTWLLAPPAILMSLLVWRAAPKTARKIAQRGPSVRDIWTNHRRVIGSLLAVIAGRSIASNAFVAFLPLLAVARGMDPAEGAQLLTVYLMTGAIGALAGGYVADRAGRDRVIVVSLIASIPFGLFVALSGNVDPAVWICAGIAGALLNCSNVGLTVRGQESVPGSLRMMSGITLGMNVGIGGLAIAPMAAIAQHTGLSPVLAGATMLALVAAGLMTFVPKAPPSAVLAA